MNWIGKLKERWKTGSTFQVIIILAVFSCTGLTVVYLMKPVLKSFFGDDIPDWARLIYAVLILPVYNILLLLYGFIFGQFHFFWNFEKRFFGKLLSLLKQYK